MLYSICLWHKYNLLKAIHHNEDGGENTCCSHLVTVNSNIKYIHRILLDIFSKIVILTYMFSEKWRFKCLINTDLPIIPHSTINNNILWVCVYLCIIVLSCVWYDFIHIFVAYCRYNNKEKTFLKFHVVIVVLEKHNIFNNRYFSKSANYSTWYNKLIRI